MLYGIPNQWKTKEDIERKTHTPSPSHTYTHTHTQIKQETNNAVILLCCFVHPLKVNVAGNISTHALSAGPI
jgi:hypothetical protein